MATVARIRPPPTRTDPAVITRPGPNRLIATPRKGANSIEVTKPTEKIAAVSARGQPNSSRIGGNRSEKAVRTLTPTPIVTNATETITQP